MVRFQTERMRDILCGCGLMPGGVWRRLRREEVQARADHSAVGVARPVMELSPPLRKGQICHRFV